MITKEAKEILGKHTSKKDSEFDKDQLEAGIAVEKEHTDVPEVAKEIAKDHLAEIKDYYTRLKKMEAGAGVGASGEEGSSGEQEKTAAMGYGLPAIVPKKFSGGAKEPLGKAFGWLMKHKLPVAAGAAALGGVAAAPAVYNKITEKKN